MLEGLAFLSRRRSRCRSASGPRRGRAARADYLVNLFCFAGISMPFFWLALLLISLFAVELGLAAGRRHGTIRRRQPFLADRRQHIRFALLPVRR